MTLFNLFNLFFLFFFDFSRFCALADMAGKFKLFCQGIISTLLTPFHLSTAGPVWGDNGPTGYGVKLLVDYLLNVKKSEQQK